MQISIVGSKGSHWVVLGFLGLIGCSASDGGVDVGTGGAVSGGAPGAGAGGAPAGSAGLGASGAVGAAGAAGAGTMMGGAAGAFAGSGGTAGDGGLAGIGGTAGGGGATSASVAARQRVIDFLRQISGSKAAIGTENKGTSNPTVDSDKMASMGGNGYPSFWSQDWGFGTNLPASRERIVEEGKKQWAKGALVQYIYHVCPPQMGSNENCAYDASVTPAGALPIKGTKLDAQQWQDLVTPGGKLYQVWIARLDTLAKYFQELKDAGVAPLFRPLHEINGSWAWWNGHPGPDGSTKLYQITHDYLVKSKGLDNIVWVFNLQDYETLAADVPKYAPGADYFDVLAIDFYNTGYSTGNYQATLAAALGKPIGIGECAQMPSVSSLEQQPKWAFVAFWPDFYSTNTNTIPALFKSDRVLKLADMPGWK